MAGSQKEKPEKQELVTDQVTNQEDNFKENQGENPEDKVDILLDLGNGLFIVQGAIDDLREQDINAHTMPAQMFRQLTDNIQERGLMESLPFCALTEKYIEIVSGAHRKRAAKAAGLERIYYILDMSGLTRDEILSKQLAHNSINGTDDPQILKQIYESIEDAEAKIRAYIDPKALEIPAPDSIPITDILAASANFKTVMFTFLPHQWDNFEKVVESISKEVDVVGVSDIAHFDKFKETLKRVKEIENIISVGMIVSKMCDIVNDVYDQSEAEIPNNGSQEDKESQEKDPGTAGTAEI
ncbi:MAG: ParB N-terminal domain-containing protein [ANME-2 cluster archaeon]|nr:ParB N-terminal domain-containing protein [ANME-2 cluster archaeon]